MRDEATILNELFLQVFSCRLWRCTVAVSCYVNYTPSVRGQPQIWRSVKGEEPVQLVLPLVFLECRRRTAVLYLADV